MEIWHSKDENATPNWNECETKEIPVSQLGDYTLATDTYNQAPDLVRYMNFNPIEEQSKTTDSVGDSKEICIVFTIPKVQFTDKQWEKMKIEDFKLHISRYPVIKEVKF